MTRSEMMFIVERFFESEAHPLHTLGEICDHVRVRGGYHYGTATVAVVVDQLVRWGDLVDVNGTHLYATREWIASIGGARPVMAAGYLLDDD